MIIVGERINTSRKSVARAVEAKDAGFIREEAKKQAEAGADYIDVNCGTSVAREVDDMKWLVETVQKVIDLPLCIDSPNPEAIKAGLELHRGKALVNSITGEKERAEKILPLVKEFDACVVALTMGEKGMPHSAEERIEIAKSVIEKVKAHGIPVVNLYFDPLVRPVSTEPEQMEEVLKTIRLIREKLGGKTICGLSNISFGLPERHLINSVFLSMALAGGLNAAIIDPTVPKMFAVLRAADALLGNDRFCLKYIEAFRQGKL